MLTAYGSTRLCANDSSPAFLFAQAWNTLSEKTQAGLACASPYLYVGDRRRPATPERKPKKKHAERAARGKSVHAYLSTERLAAPP